MSNDKCEGINCPHLFLDNFTLRLNNREVIIFVRRIYDYNSLKHLRIYGVTVLYI